MLPCLLDIRQVFKKEPNIHVCMYTSFQNSQPQKFLKKLKKKNVHLEYLEFSKCVWIIWVCDGAESFSLRPLGLCVILPEVTFGTAQRRPNQIFNQT